MDGMRNDMNNTAGGKGLLVVSFGTTHNRTCEETIGAIEESLAKAFPDRKIFRGWTSKMIIRRLDARDGIHVDTAEEALDRMVDQGIDDVLVVPTHMIGGGENDRLAELLRAKAGQFKCITASRPLLDEERDLEELAKILGEEYLGAPGALEAADASETSDAPGARGDRALVLMGHGSADKPSANEIYVRLEESFHRLGWTRAFVGTVEGTPDLEDVLGKLSGGDRAAGPAGGSTGEAATTLAPLMIVAGEHAVKDMAGEDPDSWMNRMKAAGYTVEAVKKGLGAYEGVRRMFVRHGRQARPVE